jgi:very-short-patch-repair endonuclease
MRSFIPHRRRRLEHDMRAQPDPHPAPAGEWDLEPTRAIAGRAGTQGADRDLEPIDRAIARLATTQGGVAGHGQLVALGLTNRAIAYRLGRGRLIALHRGVYAVGHSALTDRGRGFAALLAAGPGGVLSHGAAAAFLRLVPELPSPLEVTRADQRRKSRADLVVHRSSLDFQREVWQRNGLLLTSPARTIADLAATRPAPDVERAWAEAQVLKLLRPSELEAAIRPGRRGAVLLARLVGEPEPTRSELERVMLAALRRAGLPRPRVNVRVGNYLVDFFWPEQRLILETDGWAVHRRRTAFESDRMRDATLQARGFAVLRFTWRQVMNESPRVLVTIGQVLALRSHSTGREARASS